MCVENQQTSLAAPDRGDLANLHGHSPLRAQFGQIYLVRGHRSCLLCSEVVVAPYDVGVDRNDDNNEVTLR